MISTLLEFEVPRSRTFLGSARTLDEVPKSLARDDVKFDIMIMLECQKHRYVATCGWG